MRKIWNFQAAVFAAVMPIGSVVAEGRSAETPPAAVAVPDETQLAPEVTIRRTQREIVYEYRRGGQLFLVRVQPRFGPPYHFVDVNGDGSLDYRPGEPFRDNINQWLLFQW